MRKRRPEDEEKLRALLERGRRVRRELGETIDRIEARRLAGWQPSGHTKR